MAQRRLLWPLEARAPYQRLIQLQYLGALDRIRLMVDARLVEILPLVRRIEDVALHEEVLDGVRMRGLHRAFHRTVADVRMSRHRAARVIAMRLEPDCRKRLLSAEID